MADPLDHLEHALAQADIAAAALRFMPQTPAQGLALHAVQRVDGAIRRSILALSGDEQPGLHPTDGGDVSMHRRLILKLSGVMAVTAVAPLEALDRLVAQAERPRLVDRTVTDAYATLLHGYGSVYASVAPSILRPVAESILDRLLDEQTDSTTPEMRRRLGQLTSDAASFAGWLAYDERHEALFDRVEVKGLHPRFIAVDCEQLEAA